MPDPLTLWISYLIVYLRINQWLTKEIKYSIIHLAGPQEHPIFLFKKWSLSLWRNSLPLLCLKKNSWLKRLRLLKPQLSIRLLLHPFNLSISWVGLKKVWTLSGSKIPESPSSRKHCLQRCCCIFSKLSGYCQCHSYLVCHFENCRLTSQSDISDGILDHLWDSHSKGLVFNEHSQEKDANWGCAAQMAMVAAWIGDGYTFIVIKEFQHIFLVYWEWYPQFVTLKASLQCLLGRLHWIFIFLSELFVMSYCGGHLGFSVASPVQLAGS